MTQLSEPIRRLLALLALLAMLALLTGLALAPHLWAGSLKREIRAARQLHGALMRQAAQRPRLRREHAALSAARGGRGGRGVLLPGGTAGIATANLQKRIVAEMRRDRLTLKSIEALESETDGYLTRLAVRVAMRGNMAGLRSLLHAIETGLPLLFVDEMVVRMVPRRPGAPPGPAILDVTVRVSGYSGKTDTPRAGAP